MRKLMVPAALLFLATGCDLFDESKEILSGLTNPLVVQGMVLGIEAPDAEGIDLEGTDYEEGTLMVAFLADAANVDEIEDAPVTGASVRLEGDVMGSIEATEAGGGSYTITPDQGVAYVDGADWTMVVGVDGELSTATLRLAEEVTLTVPEQHSQDSPISLDLTAGAYDSALVVVLDGRSGEITYSNEPAGVKEYYDFTHSTETVGVVEIPGEAFPEQSLYAVGVAGMLNSGADDLDGMNTLLSAVMVGKMKFFPVSTIVIP